ncbi:MAG: peptidylprolyl isomerase [Planctomycetota bacterium]|jgi:hypothetical protein|nr:peptidylprolyl isomerase [Planctomycetota bacterium]
MGKARRLCCLALIALSALSANAAAAEFDIEMPRMLLRRLQLCRQCGSALLVTRVHPGVSVRCPDCGAEQPRLRDERLINQLYQMCSLCEMPLNGEGRAAGDIVECDNCHTRQALSPSAILAERYRLGKGYLPGFPPGKGDKTMLFPAADGADDMAAAGLAQIPEPGRDDLLASGVAPFPLDLAPATGGYARPVPTPIPQPPEEPPAAPEFAPPAVHVDPGPGAVDVPSVTVDMFGGPDLPDLPVRRAGVAAPADAGQRLLARIDGQPITLDNVDAVVLPALRARPEGATPERERELRRAVLDRLIQRELAVQEAKRLGYNPDWNEVRRRAEALAGRLDGLRLDPIREAEKELTMRAMRERVVACATAPDDAVRRFYEEHKNSAIRPGKLAITPLCVFEDRTGRADPRDHRAIAAEISRSFELGVRFDDMREKYDEFSVGASVPDEPVPRDHYAGEVLRAVGDLPAGAVFGPVFTPGLALFGKITAVVPPGPAPFDEVEPVIRAQLENEAGDAAFAAWIRGLAATARIELF